MTGLSFLEFLLVWFVILVLVLAPGPTEIDLTKKQ